MLLPQQHSALKNRVIEDLQLLTANIEESWLPQKVQSALTLLMDGFTVMSSVQSVVQVIFLNHLHFFSYD